MGEWDQASAPRPVAGSDGRGDIRREPRHALSNSVRGLGAGEENVVAPGTGKCKRVVIPFYTNRENSA